MKKTLSPAFRNVMRPLGSLPPASQRLRDYMIEHGITQTALAELTGINQSQISDYATGHTQMSVPSLLKICKALKIKIDDLVN
jgi:transcriptional regulator with XRE-family HTH domain